MDDTALEDGEHVLNVYKCDNKKWDESLGNVSYLALPSCRQKAAAVLFERQNSTMENRSNSEAAKIQSMPSGWFTLSPKDSLTIRSVLVSTSLTQNGKTPNGF